MMRECAATLGEGNSIMTFPEGTRSPTGEMRAFKLFAFELALRTETPIVIHGIADALPKRGFLLQGQHPIRISVLDPIPHQRSACMSVDELSDQVRRLIATELGEMQPAG